MRYEQFYDENEIPGGRCISNKNTLKSSAVTIQSHPNNSNLYAIIMEHIGRRKKIGKRMIEITLYHN